MDLSFEKRFFEMKREISETLKDFSKDLGYFRASPRDIIEIHTKALLKKLKQVIPEKEKIYTQESRFIMIELLGYLASYYRSSLLEKSENKSLDKHKQTR